MTGSTFGRSRAVIATAALLLATAAAPALAQTHAHGAGHSGFQHSTGGGGMRMSLPQTRMGGWGVRSEQPRGIGNVGGSLLPHPGPIGDRPPHLGMPQNGVPFVNAGGAGRFAPGIGRIDDGAAVRIGPGGINAGVVANGGNWPFAAALNNSIGRSWLNYGQHHHGHFDGFNDYGYYYPRYYGGSRYYGGVGAVYGSYFSNGWYPSIYDLYPGYVDPYVINGAQLPPPVPVLDPEAGMTIPEKAAVRLRNGKPDEAISMLRSFTAGNPSDDDAARTLALALLDARRTKEGIAVMALVYGRNSRLAWSPIAPDSVGPDRELRDLVVRVVEYGHKTNTASSWLTAAVLMQGEGRDATALKMLDRAATLGLDAELAKSLRTALKP